MSNRWPNKMLRSASHTRTAGRGREGGEEVTNRNAVPDPEGGTVTKRGPIFEPWVEFFVGVGKNLGFIPTGG